MSERVIRGIFGGLLLASVFALGIIQVEDTDTWTHLALGRDIIQHRGFPATEQFNFPSLDKPYFNSEWLFDVVFYLAYFLAGIPGVILLKAAVVTLAFFILFQDSLIPRDRPSHRLLDVVTAIVVLFPILLVVRHRFVERPDIALMTFLAFTIYALNAYVYEGKRYLYLLPALQVLWVNMHPSIVVVMVPFGAFVVGGQLQRVLQRRLGIEMPGTPTKSQLQTLAAVFAGVLVAAFLNPYGIGAFLVPFQLTANLWLMHEIVELQRPGFGELYGAPFIVTGLLGLGFLLTLRRLSLISVLLVVPFVYLGLSARRFVFLLAIVGAPILARHARLFVGRLKAEWAYRVSLPAGVFAGAVIVAMTGLFLTRVEPFVDPVKISGFGVNYDTCPEGALRYLDRIDGNGKLFNAFRWGGYIVWRDFPNRIPIIDGRGHVAPNLLEDIQRAQISSASLDRLQKKYEFNVAVVEYPLRTEVYGDAVPNVDLALTSPDWALVYWDDLSMVYLKRTDAFAEIIGRDEYLHVKPANGIPDLRRKLRDKSLIAPIEAELRRNISETRSSTGYMFLGVLYTDLGAYQKVVEALSYVREFPFRSHLPNAYLGLGFAYDRLGRTEQAISYYQKAARLNETSNILYSLGLAFEKSGNDREAIRYLERALDRDRHLALAYPPLIRAYRRLGMTERLQGVEAAYRQALAHGRAEEHFRKGVNLYIEKKLHEALAEFQASLEVNPANPDTLNNLGYIYFDLGQLDKALAEQRRALEINPGHANAHYGLALIYRAQGEHAKAREHLEEYLRLEPRGYWSRKAQEMLRRSRESR